MARLNLVKTDSGNYFLQGTGDRSRNADFSLYDWDGEGGDPFALASGETWEIVEGTPTVEYDPDDSDSFWSAQMEIVEAAKRKGIEVPDYAEGA
jgi:hypothetical protein